jgi:DNA-binding transcriptional ArsR family regulator
VSWGVSVATTLWWVAVDGSVDMPRRCLGTDAEDDERADAALLSVLGDEYACRILRALSREPLPAAALADRCEMSRPTVYRRLDRLEAAGLVVAGRGTDPNGRERRRFRLAADTVEVSLGPDGVEGRLVPAE